MVSEKAIKIWKKSCTSKVEDFYKFVTFSKCPSFILWSGKIINFNTTLNFFWPIVPATHAENHIILQWPDYESFQLSNHVPHLVPQRLLYVHCM